MAYHHTDKLRAERLDGRTLVAKRLAKFRAGLYAHLDGKPTALQRTLIDLATAVKRKLLQWDAKGESPTAQYLTCTRSLAQLLAQLDPKQKQPRKSPGPKPKPTVPASVPRSIGDYAQRLNGGDRETAD